MALPDTARASLRADPARACLAALVLGDLALIWALPVLVGQDLPQHLSYARILADYADPRLAFRDNFVLPAHVQPYFTAYLLLAPLTRLTSVVTACRLLYSAYVLAMAWGFTSLVRAVHPPAPSAARTPWTCLFGALLPWNPVQCVGFLPFMLSLPAFLFGAAAVVRATERSSGRRHSAYAALTLATAVTTSLHLVAGAAVVGFAALFALFRPSRRSLLAILVAGGAALTTLAVWHTVGERGLAELPWPFIQATVASEGLWTGVVRSFGVQWSPYTTKWSFVVATVLGPLVHQAKAAVGAAILALTVVVWTGRKHRPARPDGTSPRVSFALAVLAFALLVVATPAAIRLPDDICLLDFRLYVVAFMLALACLDPRWFEPLRARVAVSAFGAVVLLVWARQLTGAAGEASAVVRLVERLDPAARVLALPFHDRSEFLDEDNSVTHYFPVYYTALRGGVSSLFWGKFSHHLPVGYRLGREPSRPPDWDPSRFTRGQLVGATHVLVEWPDAGDGDRPASGAQRLRGELASGFAPMGCEGRWCLFESPKGERVSEAEEALR